MSYDIGTARGVIELGYNGRGAQQAEDDLNRINATGGEARDTLNSMGNKAGVAGLAIAGGLAVGINAAANFEQRMSAVEAVSGATGSEMDALSKKALQLGKDTAFSATEAASAIEELVKAGLPVEDVLNGAADATVALAAAGEIDLPQAATIASNALNQFNLKAEDMVTVADKIAGAANASAIDVSDFGQSLQQVGAVANLAGVSFEDTATAISLMGNAGIKGSDAGTSLKSMFSNLQPQTQKQIDLFHRLGIVTEDGKNKFYDAQGSMKSLADVSGVLKNSLKGMTDQQKQATLETIFGSDGIRAAAILANNGAKGFDKMSASIAKTKAADVAAKRMDNLKGDVEAMKGSLETAGIAVGQVLLPALTDLVGKITELTNWFLSLSDGQQKFIVITLAVVSALLLVTSGILKFIVFIGKVQQALVVLRAIAVPTWLATLGPILLVIAAIALVVGVIVLLWKKNQKFRDIVIGVWNRIKSVVGAVVDWFRGPFVDFFQEAWGKIKSGLDAVKGFFSDVWDAIKSVVETYINIIATIIKTYIGIWRSIIEGGLNAIMAVWDAIWGVFGGVITAVFGLIVAIIKLNLAIVLAIIGLVWITIKAVTMATWNAIVAVIKFVWAGIVAVVTTYINIVKAIITAVFGAIKAVTQFMWRGVQTIITAVWGVIGPVVTAGVNAIKSTITSVWNAVKSVTKTTWNAVKTSVKTAIDGVVKLVEGIYDKIIKPFANAGTWLLDIGRKIMKGLLDGIEEGIKKVTGKLKSLTSKIPKIKGPESVDRVLLKPNGELIMQSLIDGFNAMEPAINATLRDVTQMIAPQVTPTPPPGSTSAAAAAPSGPASGLRIVSGELRLDESGRAFISGVAVDAMDANDDQDDFIGRMG